MTVFLVSKKFYTTGEIEPSNPGDALAAKDPDIIRYLAAKNPTNPDYTNNPRLANDVTNLVKLERSLPGNTKFGLNVDRDVVVDDAQPPDSTHNFSIVEIQGNRE